MPTANKARMRVTQADGTHHATDQLRLLTMYHDPEPGLVGNRLIAAGG
jgi:hypothetical protein